MKERPTRMIPKLVLGAVINKVWLLPTDSCPVVINEVTDELTTVSMFHVDEVFIIIVGSRVSDK